MKTAATLPAALDRFIAEATASCPGQLLDLRFWIGCILSQSGMDCTVALIGEPGTGKTLFARFIREALSPWGRGVLEATPRELLKAVEHATAQEPEPPIVAILDDAQPSHHPRWEDDFALLRDGQLVSRRIDGAGTVTNAACYLIVTASHPAQAIPGLLVGSPIVVTLGRVSGDPASLAAMFSRIASMRESDLEAFRAWCVEYFRAEDAKNPEVAAGSRPLRCVK